MNRKLLIRSISALVYSVIVAVVIAFPITVIITLVWQGTALDIPSSTTNISRAQFWAIYRLCALCSGYVGLSLISNRKQP